MSNKKGFSFNSKKEETRVLDPDELTELKQLLKTSRMHIIHPEAEYIVPGRTIIKFLDQMGELIDQIEELKKTQE